jgi:hypothetical protein
MISQYSSAHSFDFIVILLFCISAFVSNKHKYKTVKLRSIMEQKEVWKIYVTHEKPEKVNIGLLERIDYIAI